MDGYSNPHLDLSTDYLAQDPDTTMKEAAKLDFAIDDDNNDDIMDIGEFTRAFERLC